MLPTSTILCHLSAVTVPAQCPLKYQNHSQDKSSSLNGITCFLRYVVTTGNVTNTNTMANTSDLIVSRITYEANIWAYLGGIILITFIETRRFILAWNKKKTGNRADTFVILMLTIDAMNILWLRAPLTLIPPYNGLYLKLWAQIPSSQRCFCQDILTHKQKI